MDSPLFDADDLRKLAAMLETLRGRNLEWDDRMTLLRFVDGLREAADEMEPSHG